MIFISLLLLIGLDHFFIAFSPFTLQSAMDDYNYDGGEEEEVKKDGGGELGPLAFTNRGHECFETAIGDHEVNETKFLDTIVPSALVAEGT